MEVPIRTSTRERLLEAAEDVFYREGYGVSVEAVAEHASVAKPTLYAHFRSKEALIDAVLQRSRDAFFDQLDAELERRVGDPFARLIAPFDLLVRDLPDPEYHGCICVNSAATFLSPAHPARGILRSFDDRLLAIWEALAMDARAPDPALLSRQLLLLFDGLKTRGLVDHTGAGAHDARAAAAALIGAD